MIHLRNLVKKKKVFSREKNNIFIHCTKLLFFSRENTIFSNQNFKFALSIIVSFDHVENEKHFVDDVSYFSTPKIPMMMNSNPNPMRNDRVVFVDIRRWWYSFSLGIVIVILIALIDSDHFFSMI